jgi:hypothetical protein
VYHRHNILGPSRGVGTSATAEFPHWYYPIERYVNYGVDQAQSGWRGLDDSSVGWMRLSTCRRRCMPPSTNRPACCTTSLTTLALILMLSSCKDPSLWEEPCAQVWIVAHFVPFLIFPDFHHWLSSASPLSCILASHLLVFSIYKKN